MRTEWKIQECLWFSFIVLMLFIIASDSIAKPLQSNTDCFRNVTSGEFHEETFSVESEVHPSPPFAVQLQMGMRVISYDSFRKQQICNAKIYGNCLGPKMSGHTDNRPCNYYTKCRVK
ncbi:uncharacterized protein LOC110672361 [Hevea brasiliensis]|uniref:uncharacterized protein LOC110672361 n=1 Tax=Hevea brasiliensis TaxID=3981 RepID=UPI000B76C42F|nr:uncharacterized protein LOC110672361 [Hevea brasiliensis]